MIYRVEMELEIGCICAAVAARPENTAKLVEYANFVVIVLEIFTVF